MKHLEIKIANLISALERLREVLEAPESDYKVDATIKRFEFTYEICWKTLHSALRELGIIATNPASIFDKSYKQNLIAHIDIWMQMKKDRNDTSHEYNQQKAAEIYQRIPQYIKEFELVLSNVQKINLES